MPTPKKTDGLKPLTPIIIEWEDAWAGDPLHQDSLENILAATQVYLRRTVGWFLGERHGYVVFATDWDGAHNVGGPQQIPLGMIRKITPLITCKS